MDSEEKKLLKKILSKVNKLEGELKERDEVIKELQTQRQPIKEEENKPKFPPLPKTNDRLALAIIKAAREKAKEAPGKAVRTREGKPVTVEDIRRDIDLGEVLIYVAKHKIPIGNIVKEEKEGKPIIIDER